MQMCLGGVADTEMMPHGACVAEQKVCFFGLIGKSCRCLMEAHLWFHWNRGLPSLPLRVRPIQRLPFSIRSMASTVQPCSNALRGERQCGRLKTQPHILGRF